MSSEHDYHIAAEPDVSGKVNRHIWYYFIALGIMLALTMGTLHVFYLFQLDFQKDKKIGAVTKPEALETITKSKAYLSGKIGLFPGKKHISIDAAMARFLADVRRPQ